MKKVLIITYYWPPGSGAGVFRWLKFSKYLREQGWEPVICTPSNPEAQGIDHTLAEDVPPGITVLRRRIREPYAIYKLATGRRKDDRLQSGFLNETRKPGTLEKLAAWIRGNLFIPDARKYWVRPSTRFLSRWIAENPVDAIVSTGPPHSMHLIAMRLRDKLGIPWMADFRDPWTHIDFYEKLFLTKRADRKHRLLEKNVLARADAVVAVSPHCAAGLEQAGERRVSVVPNGYDAEDFHNLPPRDLASFCITHLGAMNADRNPEMLWKVLSQLIAAEPFFSENLLVRLIGRTDYVVRESIKKHMLTSYVEYIPPLPHRKALAEGARASILLLPLNNTPNAMGITTGKLFDYLGLERPVLCIGPPRGDAAQIIRETASGACVDFNDEDACRDTLLEWARQFGQNRLSLQEQSKLRYERRQGTAAIARILGQITGK